MKDGWAGKLPALSRKKRRIEQTTSGKTSETVCVGSRRQGCACGEKDTPQPNGGQAIMGEKKESPTI